MPPPPLLFLFLLLLLAPSPSAAAASSSFSLDFFPDAGAAAQLALSGGANATAAAVSMASPGARVRYRAPIVFSPAAGLAFSTYFAFAAASPASSLAFSLTPSAAAGPREPPALAVVFSARRVRVDLAGTAACQVEVAHHSPHTRTRAWIDYNATAAMLHVRLSIPGGAATNHQSPPPLSCPLHLQRSSGPFLAGFRTPSGNCTLFSWAFHAAPYRMHSQPLNPANLLTTPPPDPGRVAGRRYSTWGAAVSLLLAAACGAMLTFIVLFLWYTVTARRPVAPVDPSDVAYQKIVLVGVKDDAANADDGAANK